MVNFQRTKETVEKITTRVISFTCDMCEKIYEDEFEMQEFHHIKFTAGYGSVFGDGDTIECDVCQHCLKKMIDGHYRSHD
jgi:hypothetical protein